ncbi:cytidine deaminase [Vibrio salinus]|uniref:cytidine deaminase n=1 Tax=Vibrio salinus TaxID=2899784 RepID=UPI001E5F7436|nr:cytidine deaminase [Vibrio salinus]MCE0496296.1 cytidine deaminase [Vibrio salinus]
MTITQRLTERFLSENTTTVCAIEHKLKYQLLEEFKTSEPELCFALLPLAASLAHVPLSGFSVGAIVKGLSGTLYFGANMEFSESAIGQTIHAEQAAFNNAWMNGETGISDIFVSASPCGHCRQFLNEITTSKELNVWVKGKPGSKLTSLLPEDFGPQDLGVHTALMANKSTEGHSELESALSRSYSPYTHSPSAVVLTMKDGTQYAGAYAENAAFNPSLPPLQSALIMCLLHGNQLADVSDVLLTENKGNKVKHGQITKLLCSVILPNATFHQVEDFK